MMHELRMDSPFQIYPTRAALERHVLSKEAFERSTPCISLYLPRQTVALSPAHRKFRMIRLLKEAEKLVAREMGVMQAREFMAKLWRTQPLSLIDQSGCALAIFHDSEFTGAMQLPVDVPERIVAARSFHIKPVLSWLQSAPPFYLISLSSRRLKLFEGSPWELKLLHVTEAQSVRGVRDPDDVGAKRGLGGRDSNYKERLRQFLLKAEAEIYPIINRDRHPVVIAGVSSLHPIFRKINRDPDLVAHAIHGNVERWGEDDLRREALKVMEKLFESAKLRALQEYQGAEWKGESSSDLTKIARAAVRGKVRKLMIASDVTLWGNIHPKTGEVTLVPKPMDASQDDVLDDLAEAVLAKGGKVLCLPSAELPTVSPAAALLTA